MKRMDLCRPCAEDVKREGKKLVRVQSGVDNKITCERCKRRRYGAAYEEAMEKHK